MAGLIPSSLGRLGAAAQNALEVARFGGLETGEESAPYEVVATTPIYNLRRYFPGLTPKDAAPVILVPPMMLSAEVWDVAPTASGVRELHAHGVDPWVVDFGAPEHIDGGLERDLTDHVLAVSDAVDQVRKETGRDVHLGGYSQGGMFCYQAAAFRRAKSIDSVIVFGSPVDIGGAVPFGLPEESAARAIAFVAEHAFGSRALPAWASRMGFRLMDPVKAVRQQVEFVMQLHDREALLPRESQRRFLQAEGWVAWPGPALADFMRQFVAHNRMLRGGFVIEDRLVTLADIDCPVLMFVGEVDEIAPPDSVRAITFAAPKAMVYERSLRAGHFGLVVGGAASRNTWPDVAAWTRWRAGGEELPETIHRATDAVAISDPAKTVDRVGYGLRLAAGVSAGIARSAVSTTTRTIGTVRELGAEAVEQLPRLAKLEQVRPRTQISLGRILDEQAEKAPDGVLFLFEDRAHTQTAAKHRIDSVVRGLISLGVRQGEHVGVLMDMRPSALVVVAALNRLGAVAVLLRPDGDVGREAALGQVTRVVTDPERIAAAQATRLQVLVLGGGSGPRDLGRGVVDMEQIDPDEVTLPRWYTPNPGRARDLAFVLFTGEGDRTTINRINNGRWALSAFGTATSASLGPGDTIYSVTPVYHPSGLLVGMGAAIAGGSRIAMARSFDATTYWDEVRRYGVTISTFTWTMLRALVEAPPHPGERHHPVRLFVGSGMPPYLWRRVLERFAPAGVVEFYTASRGDAVLVNLGGGKVGAMGRRLPGSADVRVAAYDAEAERLEEGGDGFARVCARDEVGMLLTEADAELVVDEAPLRGVFRRDDAWVATGDLFYRDADGDYWLIDPVAQMIRTAEGLVSPSAIRNALGALDAVDLAVSYGVRAADQDSHLALAAVTLRRGKTVAPGEITEALSALPAWERPAAVRVVDTIPVTTWYRPVTGPLRAEGIPVATVKQPIFYRDAKANVYKPLSAAARKRLIGPAAAPVSNGSAPAAARKSRAAKS